MWQYNYYYAPDIYHYGVLGMKWGVHRARAKSAQTKRLKKRALKYDKKAANRTKKAEKIHSKYDLNRANRLATRASKQRKKAANLEKKSLTTDDALKASRYHKKASKLQYKASKNDIKGNRLSRTTAYSRRAQFYSVRSDTFRKKAARARMQIANNDFYKKSLAKKISTISREDLNGAYSFVSDYLRDRD